MKGFRLTVFTCHGCKDEPPCTVLVRCADGSKAGNLCIGCLYKNIKLMEREPKWKIGD